MGTLTKNLIGEMNNSAVIQRAKCCAKLTSTGSIVDVAAFTALYESDTPIEDFAETVKLSMPGGGAQRTPISRLK